VTRERSGREVVEEVPVDPARATVYEHGWQSWSPATTYPADGTSWRPVRELTKIMGYRAGRPGPERGLRLVGPVAALDDWGLETTRRLLTDVPPPTPFSAIQEKWW
jgi:hypothetical protein